jgi:hypothetical protein
LYVSTADRELTVGFHTHHRHFTDYQMPLNPEMVRAGLDEAANYLADRLGVLTAYRSEQLLFTVGVPLPHDGPLSQVHDGLATNWIFGFGVGGRCDHLTLRCWTGQFD